MPNKAPLQVLPTGLLSFLGLKNSGQYPQTLGSDTLVPTLGLEYWYLGTNCFYSQAPDIAAALGGVVVPTFAAAPNAYLYVLELSFFSDVLGAGDVLTCQPFMNINNSGNIFMLGPSGVPAITGDRASCRIEGPVLVPPNATIGLFSTRFTGASQVTPCMRWVTLPTGT